MKYTPDFSSRFRILKGGKISLVVSALIAGSTMSFASPSGGTVTTGSATINQNGSVTTINQSTAKASINWNSFSIAPTETVNFVQPSAQSVTLNRVIGTSRSLIEGAMNANGQVFLINPNGVLFANGSEINVGGLVASTLNISDENFQAGNYLFEGNSQNSIINMGTITANNGYVAMMGQTVANEGTIVATMGNVQLASGEKISLNLNGNSLVKLTIDQGTMDALVENKGLIQADGGQVYLTTQALNTILDGMVNNTGIIEAKTLNDVTGEVILFAHGGTANITGTIDASGGFVETSGKELGIENGTTIKAKKWLIDPVNVTIDSSTDGIGGATVGASVIENALLNTGGNTNVTITADNDINVNADISWATNTLTLTAGNDINVNAVMSTWDEAGLALNHGASGAITMGMNADKTDFTGKISLGDSSTISINGVSQTIISDATQLQAMKDDLTGNYVLAGDINLNGVTWTPIGEREGTDLEVQFTGSFNALGHTVSNLTINGEFTYDDEDDIGQAAGMFGNIAGSANISNIRLSNASVTNRATYDDYTSPAETGALVGYATGTQEFTPVIHNTIVTGSNIQSTRDGDSVGGIVGGAYLSLLNGNALTNTTVTSKGWSAGGIIGSAYESTITDSYVAGSTVTSEFGEVGGIAGYAEAATIDGAMVKNSLIQATNTEFGNYGAGGIVGFVKNATKIRNAAAEGNTIAAMQDVGGIVGYLEDSNYDLEGNEPSTVTNSFYNVETTKIGTNLDTPASNPTGVITYGGIFENEYNTWLTAGKTHSITDSGLTLSAGYYLINNNDDFKKMIAFAYSPSSKFRLASSFTLDEGLYIPVMAGIFDGNNQTLTGLSVSQEYNSHIGLIGRLLGGAVSRLTLNDVTLDGYGYVGGVAGYAGGGNGYDLIEGRAQYNTYPSLSNITVNNFNYSHTKVFDSTTQEINTKEVSNIGAIAGYMEGATTLSSLHATGSITVDITAKIGNPYDDYVEFYNIGGLFGGLTNSSLNSASSSVSIDATMLSEEWNEYGNNISASSIGGIAGYVNSSIFQAVTTNGAIDLSLTEVPYLEGEAEIYSVGGMFGSIYDSYVQGVTSIPRATNAITLSGNADTSEVGGIAGYSFGVYYKDVKTSGDLKYTGDDSIVEPALSSIGGMIGSSSNDIIENSGSTRDITISIQGSAESVGGLVGSSNNSIISRSSYNGTIDFTADGSNVVGYNVGGLVGYNAGTIGPDKRVAFSKLFETEVEATEAYAALRTAYFSRVDINALMALGGYDFFDNSGAYESNGAYKVEFMLSAPDTTEWGVITNSTATVDIKAPVSSYVGGLVGYMDAESGGQIISSSAVARVDGGVTGTVSGSWQVGGLVGYNSMGNITDSYATIAVNGNGGDNIGGLVGYNEGGERSETVNIDISESYQGQLIFTTEEAAQAQLTAIENATMSAALADNPDFVEDERNFFVAEIGDEQFMVFGYIDLYKGTPAGSITNSYATGQVIGGSNVGGLVGEAYGTTITNSRHTTGVVVGVNTVGGLVGKFDEGSIINSYATHAVGGASVIGGLVGSLSSSTVKDSYATGYVIAEDGSSAGGLVAEATDSMIIRSYATGDVESVGENAGGLVATVTGTTVEESYAQGSVTGTDNVGGLIGAVNADSTILNVYSTGDVEASGNYVGGLIGKLDGDGITLTNSYTKGEVTLTGEEEQTNIGKLIGSAGTSTISNSFYKEYYTSDFENADFEYGQDEADMKLRATYEDAEWDIAGTDGDYPTLDFDTENRLAIWAMNGVGGGGGPGGGEPGGDGGEDNSGGGSTPEPEQQQTQQQVNNIVTTIVNSTTVTPPALIVLAPLAPQPQQTQTQTQNNALLQSIMPQGGSFELVGTTDGMSPAQSVSMEQLQQAGLGQGINEIRVPLGQDSIVELINGGVNLPQGLSQEFYVVNNTKKSKKN